MKGRGEEDAFIRPYCVPAPASELELFVSQANAW